MSSREGEGEGEGERERECRGRGMEMEYIPHELLLKAEVDPNLRLLCNGPVRFCKIHFQILHCKRHTNRG